MHGPENILRRQRLAGPDFDATALVAPTPVQARQPATQLPGPGHSSTRGYVPSREGLESIASGTASIMALVAQLHTFTPDELAARTPRSIYKALGGPDAAFWLPAVLKDFAIIRDGKCIINVTSVRPTGPAPPPVEQRFKIKYRDAVPIALVDIPPEYWKARTITRGDRFKYGIHYDATAAPVVHTPALKALVAWAWRSASSSTSGTK